MYSIVEYFNQKGISYSPGGTKNVSKGWIGLQCPFCNDHSNHLGVNIQSGQYKCWMCKAKGNPVELVKHFEDCSWTQAKEILQQYTVYDLSRWKAIHEEDTERITQVKLPFDAVNELKPLHKKWLEKRRFDPEETFYKYDLKSTGVIGDWKFRLIIPIYMNHKLVSFLGRDITDQQGLKYKNCKKTESIVPVHHCLYNIDRVGLTAVVMEGVTDVWRFGDGGVATLGDSYTTEQIRLLHGIKRLFTFFDAEPEAQELAEKFSYDATAIVPEVENLELDSGDPADMSQDDILHLRRQLFGRI